MAIVINGSGTVTGLAVGGLPDGTVDDGTVASGIASSKLTGALPAISGASLTGLTSAQMPTGNILQVKTSGAFSNSETTSSSFVDTGMSVSITPISTSSKILLVGSAFVLVYGSSSDLRMGVKIMRGSTAVWNTDGGRETFQVRGSPAEICSVLAINALDSPSSSSEVTYMTQIAKNNSGITATRLFTNTQGSYLTAIEIAG